MATKGRREEGRGGDWLASNPGSKPARATTQPAVRQLGSQQAASRLANKPRQDVSASWQVTQIGYWANEPAIQPVSQPVHPPASQPTSLPASKSPTQLANQSANVWDKTSQALSKSSYTKRRSTKVGAAGLARAHSHLSSASWCGPNLYHCEVLNWVGRNSCCSHFMMEDSWNRCHER